MDGIKETHLKYLVVLMLLGIATILIVTSREGYDDKGNVEVNKIGTSSEQGPARGSALGISAETSGSSPESGATSRLKQAYDTLVSLGEGYGDTQPIDYPYDHGTYWNRILYAAFYSPPGTATEQDVLSGKTFYSQYSRQLKTGTAQEGTYPAAHLQQYVQYDDAHASDYEGEESEWINTNSSAGSEVWYDTRTGLYWARSEPTTLSNSFPAISSGSCPFFDSIPRSSYTSSNTSPACGNAINACATLSLETHTGQLAQTDWYLPSQKELKTAYINGIYNQTSTTFATTSAFWSSTEYSTNVNGAWYLVFSRGSSEGAGSIKGVAFTVRCVRRD
ncbi:DUF1566 domain-containing protein [Patescibacteria group bacterium]|nr:DUF1566 domain-containing protein [Patescibacteria group bacterium]